MLGIRTTVKEDLQCTSSELVYGTTLKLPGQFVAPDTLTPLLDPSKYVHRLRHHMSQFSPATTRVQHPPTQVPRSLSNCSHVFIRCDAVRRLYSIPIRVPTKCCSVFLSISSLQWQQGFGQHSVWNTLVHSSFSQNMTNKRFPLLLHRFNLPLQHLRSEKLEVADMYIGLPVTSNTMFWTPETVTLDRIDRFPPGTDLGGSYSSDLNFCVCRFVVWGTPWYISPNCVHCCSPLTFGEQP